MPASKSDALGSSSDVLQNYALHASSIQITGRCVSERIQGNKLTGKQTDKQQQKKNHKKQTKTPKPKQKPNQTKNTYTHKKTPSKTKKPTQHIIRLGTF